MTISLLIASCDRPELLRVCLDHVLRNTRLPDEIILIDQSADNRTEAVACEMSSDAVPIRREPMARVGKAAALNRAIAMSAGDFLALTDDDVMVSQDWFASFLAVAAKHPDVNAFCGQVQPEANTRPEEYVNLVLGAEERWIDRSTNPISPSFCGADLFLRRSTVRQVGDYNPRFGPGAVFRNNDDGELAYRLTRAGERILYSPELVVYHSGWRCERDNWQLVADYAFGLGAFAGLYLRRRDAVPALYLVRKFIYKSAHILVGLASLSKTAIIHDYVHLREFCRGGWKGLTTP